MHEHVLIGRITGLQIFRVPEFGTRASFKIECEGRRRAACCIAGDVAREFITYYGEGDMIAIRGTYESRPSTASSGTPWAGRFRVRALLSCNAPELPRESRTEQTGTVPVLATDRALIEVAE